MSDLIITFDKSSNDVPVLVVTRKGFSFLDSNSLNIINIFTGEEAEQLYKLLTQKKEKKEV